MDAAHWWWLRFPLRNFPLVPRKVLYKCNKLLLLLLLIYTTPSLKVHIKLYLIIVKLDTNFSFSLFCSVAEQLCGLQLHLLLGAHGSCSYHICCWRKHREAFV